MAAVVLVVGLVAATADVAARLSSFEVLTTPSDLSGLQSPPVSVSSPSITPVRAEFLEAELGASFSELLAHFASGSDTPPEGRARGEVGPAGGTADGPSPTTTTTFPGPVESPLPQFSELAVAMAADRNRVDPGDHILYTVTVSNVGNRDFRGDLTIRSHHPFWTTDSSTPCGDPGVDADPSGPCVNPPIPVPGTPSDEVHTVQFSFGGTIEPGEAIARRFRVRVNPGTPSGTRIENHAHLDVVGDDRPPETTAPVVVRVR